MPDNLGMLMRQVPQPTPNTMDKGQPIPLAEANEQVGELHGRTRLYRVASVSESTNSFGLEGIILVRRNGEAWEVGRSRYGSGQKLAKGDIVKVAQMHLKGAKPSFQNVEIPRKLTDAPPDVVKLIWDGASGEHIKGWL